MFILVVVNQARALQRKRRFMSIFVSLLVCVFLGYICTSKLVPVSQYLGTVLVCLLGVTFLRGEVNNFNFQLAGDNFIY